MSDENTTLLQQNQQKPVGPNQYEPLIGTEQGHSDQNQIQADEGIATSRCSQFKIALAPGLEFVPERRDRYGLRALLAAFIIFIAFIIIEIRNCTGPSLYINRLQWLHIALILSSGGIFLLSLFGVGPNALSRGYKILYWAVLLVMIIMCGLIIWSSVEAAVNPCLRTFSFIPVDFGSYGKYANVFNRNDVIGIIVLGLDLIATYLLLNSAYNYYQFRRSLSQN